MENFEKDLKKRCIQSIYVICVGILIYTCFFENLNLWIVFCFLYLEMLKELDKCLFMSKCLLGDPHFTLFIRSYFISDDG